MINGVRVFDTVLDSQNLRDTVSRNSADFWRPLCKSANWDFSHERLHSFQDVEFFLSRKIKENVIVFSGHGLRDGFHLTNGDLLDGHDMKPVPAKNHGKIVIFSSCLIGASEETALQLKDYLKADILFAYQYEMSDRYCFLYESILLSSIEHFKSKKNGEGSFTRKHFELFQEETMFMKNMNLKGVKKHPMLMF